MDLLVTKFKQVLGLEVSTVHLHNRIMWKILLSHLKPYLIAITSLLHVSLILSAWRIWTRMVDLGTISVLRDMLQGFNISYAFLYDFATTLIAFTPLFLISIFAVNLLVLLMMFRLLFQLKKNSLDDFA